MNIKMASLSNKVRCTILQLLIIVTIQSPFYQESKYADCLRLKFLIRA